MAKRTRTLETAAQETLNTFAEDLGTILGTTRKKAETWLSQRERIAKELVDVRDSVNELLSRLGHTATNAYEAASGKAPDRSKEPKGVAKVAGAAKKAAKRVYSAETRAKMAGAAKKRWAAAKKAGLSSLRRKG